MATQLPFHTSKARERIVRGGKRSGKTISAGAEFAAAVTQQNIIGPDGKPLPYNYPVRPLLTWIIGYDLAHIGQTLYRVLFEPGYMQIIKDKKTDLWRAFNPADPEDAERESESRPADPLIPSRFYNKESWSWDDKAQRVFNTCQLNNGTRICAFPSTAPQAKQGDAADLIWIDEDIRFSKHVKEYQDRLPTNRGRLIWSAWPHTSNEALHKMSDRAAEQVDDPEPIVQEVVLRFSDNPFVTWQAKREAYDSYDSEEERRARDYGEFLFDEILMYQFMPSLHGVPNENDKCPINKIYKDRGEFPREWTRFLVLDPGHAKIGVLFGVIPPPSFGDVAIVEGELFQKRADCDQTAKAVAEKVAGRHYETFIIDKRAGRQTPMGGSKTVATQYAEAFNRYGIKCRASGSYFQYGSDNVPARTAEVRGWMHHRPGQGTKLRVVLDRTPQMQKEFKLYSKKVMAELAKDEPVPRNNDLMNCLEYWVASRPRYVSPEESGAYASPARKEFARWQRLAQQQSPDSKVIDLGAPALV